MTFSQWFKKQSLLFKGLVIGGIAFLLLVCLAVASLSNQGKKEETPRKPTSPWTQTPPESSPWDKMPPELTIAQPADESVADKNQITISGTTWPGAILKLNEQQQSVSSDGSFSFSYTLQSGENILSFTSTSVLGNTTKKEITITYNPPPPPPAPTVQQPPPQQPAGDVTVHEGQEEPYSE